MKTSRHIIRTVCTVLVLSLMFVFSSCVTGGLKLKSFTVDPTSYKASYSIGDTVDFSNIKVFVKYTDSSLDTELGYDDITVTYAEDITATAGQKVVTISYDDPNLKSKQTKTITITVTDGNDPGANGEKAIIAEFAKSETIVAFESQNSSAGKTEYGESGFSGEFLKGNILYVIGDDNAFKMVPSFIVLDENLNPKSLSAFYSVVEISVFDGETEIKLDKRAGDGNICIYSKDGADIVTVDTYNGEYQFHAPVDKVKISVMPSEDYYIVDGDVKPVELTAKVIDAYNVYTATELAVINNTTREAHKPEWDTFRLENGLPSFDVINSIKGVVLHADLHISKNDVPDYFFVTTDKDIVYWNGEVNNSEKKIIPAGTSYLRDNNTIYERVGAGEFVMEGNFFTIDTKGFPLVASPSVFDSSLGLDYGSDFSNVELFRFETGLDLSWTQKPDDIPVVSINNISFIGNAGRNNWVDAQGNLVSAGGLLLLKVSYHADVTVNNVISNSFYITYIPDWDAVLTVNDTKCYDSYQTAFLAWSNCHITVNDSFVNGTGGPAVLAQSIPANGTYYNPIAILNNTVVDTALTGEEIWFQVVNATAICTQIKALGDGLEAYGLGNLSKDGKLNMMGVLMPEGSSPMDVIGNVEIEGTLIFDGSGAERWFKDPENTNPAWLQTMLNPYFQGGAFILSVQDAEGVTHSVAVVPTEDSMNLFDMNGNQLNPYGDQAAYGAAIAPFMAADTATLHMGGLSIIFEFYHK